MLCKVTLGALKGASKFIIIIIIIIIIVRYYSMVLNVVNALSMCFFYGTLSYYKMTKESSVTSVSSTVEHSTTVPWTIINNPVKLANRCRLCFRAEYFF
jgi:hypothetical protein